jgi:hypothetical protein
VGRIIGNLHGVRIDSIVAEEVAWMEARALRSARCGNVPANPWRTDLDAAPALECTLNGSANAKHHSAARERWAPNIRPVPQRSWIMSLLLLSPVFRLARPRPLPFVPLRALPPPVENSAPASSVVRAVAVRERSRK